MTFSTVPGAIGVSGGVTVPPCTGGTSTFSTAPGAIGISGDVTNTHDTTLPQPIVGGNTFGTMVPATIGGATNPANVG